MGMLIGDWESDQVSERYETVCAAASEIERSTPSGRPELIGFLIVSRQKINPRCYAIRVNDITAFQKRVFGFSRETYL